MIEEPLKYSKDVKYDSRRIVGMVVMNSDEQQPMTGIIEYTFTEVGDVMHVTNISFYCSYPHLARKMDHNDLIDQIKMDIQGMEDNVQFETNTVTIL